MKPLTAYFIGGKDDPSTCRVASLPLTLRFPAFTGGLALIRTERVYRRIGAVNECPDHDEATYRFAREKVVHGG